MTAATTKKTDEEELNSAYYFWGGIEDGDALWETLHAHFEKLAREDGEAETKDTTGVGA